MNAQLRRNDSQQNIELIRFRQKIKQTQRNDLSIKEMIGRETSLTQLNDAVYQPQLNINSLRSLKINHSNNPNIL
jgi:hypothetical protein